MSDPKENQSVYWEVLRQVMDPEIGCNIVDLGLVYSVDVHEGNVSVKMTLTTKGCPMHDSLVWGVQTALQNVEEVENVDVELVWDPPWTPAMMTEYGRACVGYRE